MSEEVKVYAVCADTGEPVTEEMLEREMPQVARDAMTGALYWAEQARIRSGIYKEEEPKDDTRES